MPDRVLPSGAVVYDISTDTSSQTNKASSDYGYQQNAGAGRGFVNPTTPNDSNPFSHQTNNVTPGNMDTSGIKTSEVAVEFQPNLLDNYDAVTYHWKFYMTSPDASSTGRVADPDVQTMIAESGVTDLTIDNITLKAVAPPNVLTGTGTQTEFKFEIVEPAGAGLMDKMFYQSISLGIGNWVTIPFYLQLEFRARDPNTSNSDINLGPNAIGNLKWIWPIKITSVKANVTTVGTRYSFDAIAYNELTQSNTYFSIQHNIVLKSIGTVGDALSELEDKLNFDQREKLIDNYSIADVYKIHVDAKISKYNVTPPNNNVNSVRNNSYDIFTNKSASFNTGTSIDKIIDTLLANTDEYQTSVVHSTTPGGEGVSINQEPEQMKKFWRIVTSTRQLAFDPRRNDYSREFTVYVVPYDISVLDANTFQSEDESKQTSVKRFLTYIGKNILKKKYNYIFTGLNDQIIAFDLNFNFAFASAVARFGGIYINSAMPDKGVVNNKKAEEEKQITEKLSRVISLQNSAGNYAPETIKATEDYYKAVKASKLSPAEQDRQNRIIQMQKAADVLNYKEGNMDSAASLSQNVAYAKALAKPVDSNIPAFVSDVDIKSTEAVAMYSDFLASRKSSIRPIAHIEQVQDMSAGQGVEPNSNSGIAKLSSMFSVALHSGVDANLISVKLTIKGDPYWLFPAPLADSDATLYKFKDSPEAAIDYIKNNQRMQNTTVNLNGTDNFILIRFRTPRVYPNGNTGSASSASDAIVDVETYSGVYKIIYITSRFEMGRFVQDLECILDPNINLTDISALIEEDAKKKDIPLTVDTFRQNKNYNPTYAPNSYNASNGPTTNTTDAERINAQAAARLKRQG